MANLAKRRTRRHKRSGAGPFHQQGRGPATHRHLGIKPISAPVELAQLREQHERRSGIRRMLEAVKLRRAA